MEILCKLGTWLKRLGKHGHPADFEFTRSWYTEQWYKLRQIIMLCGADLFCLSV